jgi:hypothetical protein
LTSLVIAAGAELEAVRGAAPELLMAGHLVDAGDRALEEQVAGNRWNPI